MRQEAGQGMNFLEAIFSFVFGDGNPNESYDDRRWRLVGAAVFLLDWLLVLLGSCVWHQLCLGAKHVKSKLSSCRQICWMAETAFDSVLLLMFEHPADQTSDWPELACQSYQGRLSSSQPYNTGAAFSLTLICMTRSPNKNM